MPDRLLAPLPDLFLRPDGTRVTTAEEWLEHRTCLPDLIVSTQYGGMPPAPKKVKGRERATSVRTDMTAAHSSRHSP